VGVGVSYVYAVFMGYVEKEEGGYRTYGIGIDHIRAFWRSFGWTIEIPDNGLSGH
jgi:hypothetical protein